MAVAVVTPNVPQQRAPEKPDKKDNTIDKIMKALYIANGTLGIATDVYKIKNYVDQQPKLLAETENAKKQNEILGLQASGLKAAAAKAAESEQGIFTPTGLAKHAFTNKLDVVKDPSMANYTYQMKAPDGTLTPVYFKQRGDLTDAKLKSEIDKNNAMTSSLKGPGGGAAKKFSNEKELRNEINNLPEVKTYKIASEGYNSMLQGAKADSAAGDMALIFGYMKLLDPNSTVREGEYATAEQARGVPDTVINLYNKVISGERLAPTQRTDFLNVGHLKLSSQLNSVEKSLSNYDGVIKKYGLDRDNIITQNIRAVEAYKPPDNRFKFSDESPISNARADNIKFDPSKPFTVIK